MAVSQRQPSLKNSKQYSIKCLLSQGTGDLVLRGSKCINLKENCPQVSGENGASGLGCGEMEGVPVPDDLPSVYEFAVRQVKETGMCMKPGVVGRGGSRLFLGFSSI